MKPVLYTNGRQMATIKGIAEILCDHADTFAEQGKVRPAVWATPIGAGY